MKKSGLILGITLLLAASCTTTEWINTEQISYDADGISVSRKALEGMIVGETKQLSVVVTPAEADDKRVAWTSDDPTIVEVSAEGLVKALATGETVIRVKSLAKPELVDSCRVTVTGSSGIKVVDYLLDEEITPELTFIRKTTGNRDYKLFVAVHNSYDTSVQITSSDPEVAEIVEKDFDGQAGFTIVPKTKLGTTTITIQSNANDDVSTTFTVKLETVSVTGIKLSLKEDGSDSGVDIAGDVTCGKIQKVLVVFSTDKPGVTVPEITDVNLSSSNTSVATVPLKGTFDNATQTVSFNITMVDNPANAPTGKSVITAISEDGNFTAQVTVTAVCPAITNIILDKTVSDPIHAGETMQLSYTLEPAEPYNSTVLWSSADESVATVDANGLVTVKPDFVFDPENASATEIKIRATSATDAAVYSECTLKPYQYVEATGVMVTDQWGNRMRGTSSTTSKISSSAPSQACIQYVAGSGKNKTEHIGVLKPWAIVSPPVLGVDQAGSIPVYLTATPYPYTYPTIADPEQPFYWACYSNSRFPIAQENFEDGSTALGWTGYSKDDGKSRLFLGHTCKFFTGHSSSTADVLFVRVYKYVPGKANSSAQSKTLLLRFAVHTIYKDGTSNGNPLVKNADGTVAAFRFLNDAGIPLPFADPCPHPWTGPMPVPGEFWRLDEGGDPTGVKEAWPGLVAPTSLVEMPK